MFQIKICGITTPADAVAAAEAGADAIGLNFYPLSKRAIDVGQAQDIAAAVGARVVKVGVFVNATADDIRTIVDEVGLDLIQLHGDEPADLLEELKGFAVMRAFAGDRQLATLNAYLEECRRRECSPRMVLVDGAAPGEYGGTGHVADWRQLAASRLRVPVVLAGGLRPGNVAEAIAIVRPAAVDTASGVEEAPGRKSRALMQKFVAAARAAFTKLDD